MTLESLNMCISEDTSIIELNAMVSDLLDGECILQILGKFKAALIENIN